MSEYSDFTRWVKHKAKTARYKGKLKIIGSCYFTTDVLSNSDNFIIEFTDGTKSENFKDIDYDQLYNKFKKS